VESHQGTGIAEFTLPKFCVDVTPGTTGELVCDVHSLASWLLHHTVEKILALTPHGEVMNPYSLSRGRLVVRQLGSNGKGNVLNTFL
jgi:hypothetical protein